MEHSLQTKQRVSDQWVALYLHFLKIERESAGFEALRRLTRAQVRGVPFENSASLIRRARHLGLPVPALDPDAMLTSWIRREAGGVCFDISSQFHRLLQALGYDASPILARISFPGSHHAIVVRLGADRYLLDVGCGSPLTEPIPLDRETEWTHTSLRFRFMADDAAPNCWRQDRWIGEKWEPFCQYELTTAEESQRFDAYQKHHEPGFSWVTSSQTMIFSDDDNLYQFRDGLLTHYTASGKTTSTITARPELERMVTDIFGLPNYPLDDALRSRDTIDRSMSP